MITEYEKEIFKEAKKRLKKAIQSYERAETFEAQQKANSEMRIAETDAEEAEERLRRVMK